MKKIPEELKEKLTQLGVENINNPSTGDLKIILDAYVKTKAIDEKTFNDYMSFTSPQVQSLLDGLKSFSESQAKISVKFLDIIKDSIDIFKKELERDLSKKEREGIRQDIFKLIKEAKEESDKSRGFFSKLACIGAGVVVVGIGGGVYVLTKGKNTQIMTKGAELLGKAV